MRAAVASLPSGVARTTASGAAAATCDATAAGSPSPAISAQLAVLCHQAGTERLGDRGSRLPTRADHDDRRRPARRDQLRQLLPRIGVRGSRAEEPASRRRRWSARPRSLTAR